MQLQEQDSYEMMSNVETQYSEATDSQPFQKKTSTSKTYIPSVYTISTLESRCWFCRKGAAKENREPLSRSRIPRRLQELIWRRYRIFVPETTRICPKHIVNGKLDSASEVKLLRKARLGARLTTNQISWLIHFNSKVAASSPIDLDHKDLSSEEYKLLFGITKDQFLELTQYCKGRINNSCNRSIKNALGFFLAKLRLGVSQKLLGFLFGLSQQRLSDTFWNVAKALESEFVGKNLGFGSLTREQYLKDHDSQFVRKLYKVPKKSLILFLDCKFLQLLSITI